MTANRWQIGVQYDPHRGNVNWSQPGGPGTPVYPQQENQIYQSINTIPVGGLTFFSEFSGWYMVGCGHSVMQAALQMEWDYTTNSSVCLVMCPMCSYVQYTIEPFTDCFNPVTRPIIVI